MRNTHLALALGATLFIGDGCAVAHKRPPPSPHLPTPMKDINPDEPALTPSDLNLEDLLYGADPNSKAGILLRKIEEARGKLREVREEKETRDESLYGLAFDDTFFIGMHVAEHLWRYDRTKFEDLFMDGYLRRLLKLDNPLTVDISTQVKIAMEVIGEINSQSRMQ